MAINTLVVSKLPVIFGSTKSFHKTTDVSMAFRDRQLIRFDYKIDYIIQVKYYFDLTLV